MGLMMHAHEHEEDKESGTVVKLDGLKMVLKVPQESIAKAQMQEEKEKEVVRPWTPRAELSSPVMSSPTAFAESSRAPLRRRAPQAERENADYLYGRNFKTTAADRSARKELREAWSSSWENQKGN